MKKIFFSLIIIMLPLLANAKTVEIDGIYYYLTSEGNVAKVTSNPNKYTGNISIPPIVIYESVAYNVTSIGDNAFINCSGLTSVTIPNGVTKIGDEAFHECSGLTSIIIPNGVTSIGGLAFEGCSALTSVTIPTTVTSIGVSAFNWCRSLKSITIPNSITRIEANTFRCCTTLASVTIPNSIMHIGKDAFYDCIGLNKVIIQDIASWCNIEFEINTSNPLYYAQHLYSDDNTEITNLVIPDGVEKISSSLFQNCSGFISVSIPQGVTSIGNMAFSGCFGLTSVTIPNSVTSLGFFTFQDCTGLTSVTIPTSVTSINDGAFYNCRSLGFIEIPEGVVSIGKSAFQDCVNLQTLILPSTLNSINQRAFYHCKLINQINILASNPPSLYDYDDTFSAYSATVKVPKGCKEKYINASVWKNFTNIIDTYKYNLTYLVDNEIFKAYEIEEGESVTPEPDPTKEGHTFSGWSEIPATMPAHDVTITGTFSVNKYKLVYNVDGAEYKSYDVEFGATITPETVPTKEGYTFSGWSEIPATMPAHDVTVMGTFTVNKYKLTYKIDGEEYKSYDVEFGATITPETAPTKEGYTFSGWSEIPATMPAHDVTVTGTFTQIDYVVGETTYEVQNDEVSVKDGSKQRGEVEIQTTVVINDQTYKVTSIADNAFKGNTAITSVTIPNSITQIGANAFEGCTSLSEINIGNAVSSIGSKAFANITSASNAPRRAPGTGLKLSCYAESVPSTASNAFENTSISNGTLLVEDNSVTAYKNSAPWNGFGTIMGFKEATGIEKIWSDENGKAKIFSIDGKPINTPQKGAVIIRMNNGETRKVMVK